MNKQPAIGKYFLLTLIIIIIDQTTKLLVYYNMEMGLPGQIKLIDDWLKLHYTLNPGMAFGLELGSANGKMILTIFRLIAMFAIAFYLYTLTKKDVHPGLLWSIALILGGAVGNVIDSTFYGVLLNNAEAGVSTPWFHGQVIDMIYVDIWDGYVADWVPLWGGTYKSLWPIFNIADASIFIGVCIILIMQRKFFGENQLYEKASTNL